METNIILALELHKLDVLGVLPPFLPVLAFAVIAVGVGLGDGNVTNAGVKPNVENLASVILYIQTLDIWDRDTPFQIARDGARLETLVNPRLSDGFGVGAPTVVRGRLVPVLKLVGKLIELQVQVLCLARLGRCAINLAAGVDKPTRGLDSVCSFSFGGGFLLLRLERVKNGTAGVALITACTFVAANGAFALDESVGKESVVSLDGTERLNSLIFVDVAVLPELGKDILDDVGLMRSGGLVKDVEINAEPVVDGLVKGVVLGAKRGGIGAFFKSLSFRGSTVLIL